MATASEGDPFAHSFTPVQERNRVKKEKHNFKNFSSVPYLSGETSFSVFF